MDVSVRKNQLPLQETAWRTQNGTLTEGESLGYLWDLKEGLYIDLDLLLDNATYRLSFDYTVHLANSSLESIPLQVSVRQTQYPFLNLTL